MCVYMYLQQQPCMCVLCVCTVVGVVIAAGHAHLE